MRANYHAARKKNKAYNFETKQYEFIESYKFELFYFDIYLLCSIDKFGVIEAKREEEFAPVKNATGDNSPETAR